MNNKAVLAVNKKFEQKREERELLKRSRQEEVYNKIPEIKDLDEKLTGSIFKIFTEVSQGKYSPDEATDRFKTIYDSLILEKERLLSQEGYTLKYLEPSYNCNVCKDTGFDGKSACSCYKNSIINELYEESNLGNILKSQTFDKFDLSFYSKSPTKTGISPRENMASILNESKEFVRNFDKSRGNLLFYGPPGLGKTFLSSSIANEIIKMGKSVFYQSAGQIFSKLEDLKFGRSQDGNSLNSMLMDVDLLIIDDLGTEFISTFNVSEAFRIVNSRILNEKSTVISTNLSLNDIKKIYSERLLSRILGHFTQLKFYGEDIRFKK